jgi:hypothetical protein
MAFDYDLPAELFIRKRKSNARRTPTEYRRSLGAWMHVGKERYNSDKTCRLYESYEYPLRRGGSGDG